MHRSHIRWHNIRLYLLITLLCGLFTLFIELVSQSTSHFQSYTEQRLEKAMRKAVKSEVEKVTRNQM